ncbi:MAG: YybH family protein [Terriglobia bacterium]
MQKGLVWRVGIAVCLGISVGCQRQTGLSKADQAAIRQTQENDVKLTNAQDWKGDLALYAEDAILMPPNQAAVQGKVPLQAWMEAYPPITNLQEQSVEIEGEGNLAYERGTYSMTVTHVGAAATEDHGKYLTIWRKQAGGSWRIARAMFNSDLPLPAPAPEKPAVHHKKTTTRRHARHRKRTHKPQTANSGQ